jgi:hypothetical protein
MTEQAAEPPTLGQVLHDSLRDSAPAAFSRPVSDFATWDRLPPEKQERMEIAAADVEAAAIARLGQPAKLAAAMTENVRLRKELDERDAQLADALTPTAADFDHAAEIMRLRGLIDELLDCTGLDDSEKAEWLARASIDLEDE